MIQKGSAGPTWEGALRHGSQEELLAALPVQACSHSRTLDEIQQRFEGRLQSDVCIDIGLSNMLRSHHVHRLCTSSSMERKAADEA